MTQSFNKKRNLVLIALIINLIVLGFFKYFNFFSESFSSFFQLLGFGLDSFTLKLILPLGISFYVFQTLTYVFDIYYENISVKYRFLDFAVFASFFPTVVAGPIERASRLLPQINNERLFNTDNLKIGISLIVVGLFRKVVIGDTCGKIVNHIFADPQYFTSLEVFVAVILYSIQIYNDFAGYSNIAKGVAKLLGFDIYINFKQPYFATSVADFWRRWHISLSLWLKDYLFTPLQLKFRNYKIWSKCNCPNNYFYIMRFMAWAFLDFCFLGFSSWFLHVICLDYH